MLFQVKESKTIAIWVKKKSVLVNLYGLQYTDSNVLTGAIMVIYNFVCPEEHFHSSGQYAFFLFKHMDQEEITIKIISFLLYQLLTLPELLMRPN